MESRYCIPKLIEVAYSFMFVPCHVFKWLVSMLYNTDVMIYSHLVHDSRYFLKKFQPGAALNMDKPVRRGDPRNIDGPRNVLQGFEPHGEECHEISFATLLHDQERFQTQSLDNTETPT